jgi:hypothetical protein
VTETLASSIETVQHQIIKDFPELWPYVDVALSVAAVLCLEHAADCPTAIFIGGSGTGKSTVVEMFNECHRTHVSDNFTPAAFVTQAAGLTDEQRSKADLLPRIRHKVMLTSECGTLFRGKIEAQGELFKVLTRVLDGRGFWKDAGTGGGRGYKGDYLFGWIGGTTEVAEDTWREMANLGSRVFFCRMPMADSLTPDALVREVLALEPYQTRLLRCTQTVTTFVDAFFQGHGVRAVQMDTARVPHDLLLEIANYASIVSAIRGMSRTIDDEEGENPRRAFNILTNVAMGHALVHGRSVITPADLDVVERLGVGSLPRGVSRLMAHLLDGKTFSRKEATAIVRPKGRDESDFGQLSVDKSIKALTSIGVIAHNGHVFKPLEKSTLTNLLELKGKRRVEA